jgi:YhcH/YjgK/YiaL family protein
MILDVLENRERYGGVSPGIERAFDYLATTDFTSLEDGRHRISADEIYAIVNSYDTEPAGERRFEAHRKYLDVQYILSGREFIYWSPAGELRAETSYSEDEDIMFLCGEAQGRLLLTPGAFALFYPEDAHKPNCAVHRPEPVRKVVIKVRID